MSEEYEQDAQNQSDGEMVGDESYDAGDTGDSAFVVSEAKKPISKSTVVMFVIILCAKAGMYYMYKRTVPSKAEASDPKSAQVIKQFMSDKEKNFSLMQKMLKDTEAVVQQFLNYPSLKQIPLTDLQTNPFRMGPVKTDEETAKKDEEKARLAEIEREKAEQAAVTRDANGLNLQSVVHSGSRKACMVNNTLYTEGQIIQSGDSSFLIEQIAPNQVIVRTGKFKFQLRMQK